MVLVELLCQHQPVVVDIVFAVDLLLLYLTSCWVGERSLAEQIVHPTLRGGHKDKHLQRDNLRTCISHQETAVPGVSRAT